MTREFGEHVLVPVASETDARTTARALELYAVDRLTVLHVVEKGEGVPDKTPVEQSEQIAEASFAAIRETFPDAETELAYGRDVAETISEVATELDASAIVFRPREGGRLRKWLSGDWSQQLLSEADRPVITLPGGDE
jgi:nucleotide-binding universal stress UspA family protein